MPSEITPKKLQKAKDDGFKRLENFRSARMLFLRQFVGQYYDAERGLIGSEPLNLIFNAIRVLLPNLVFNFPVHQIETRFLAYRPYGDMLAQALSQQDKQLKIRNIYRRWIVDSLFTLGILKTGICDSGTAINFNENDHIDPGTVYTENVDFDNFVFDPNARRIEDALFIGDRMRIARQSLLDSGLYDNDAIMRLPSAGSDSNFRDGSDSLSAGNINLEEMSELEDEVDICELYVPRAKAIVTLPGGCDYSSEDYLRIADYYGPDSGPYTLLQMTPPVPNNPLPISMVGIWHDIHIMANRMAKKIMEQADRQKDIIGYKGMAADDAKSALDANDGDTVMMDDPDSVKTFSFGGQQRTNETHIQQLQQWFNMMAGNPEGMAGLSMNAKSATEANMLQSNAQTSLEDMKDLVYMGAAEEAGKRAWYLHTDPLLEVPLTRRVQSPPQMIQTPLGPQMMPGQRTEIQVILTPEARCGDFLDFNFSIQPESMGRIDSEKKLARAMEFAVKILPAAAQAAQVCMAMGVAFSFPRFAEHMAKDAGITWMDEVFNDPEFQQRMMLQMMRGPQLADSKGQVAGAGSNAGVGGGLPGVMQNGQSPMAGATMNPDEQANSDAQMGAADGQAALPNRSSY